MSDTVTQATVNLLINGQQAQQTLNQLRQNALQLETAIAKAAAVGNKSDLKKLRKELTDTRRQIREMESATQQVETVLSRLDRATPKELQRTLGTLNRQLEYIERGSDAWKAHTEKIRRVRAEIAAVNSQLRDQEGFWDRFNRRMNDWQTTMMAGIATISGFIMAGRSAVKAYAEMDEELTNTRKYTGMVEEEVDKLNDSFRSMDTRSSREQLNELAQEAGRLGKNTRESVQGYVEAADIINVALVDLGAGATQTIAKLTNIFGVEELLGTKDAMLAVGSTVNVLSQNCTASKQYLVEFAQRMAGIGAQANLSIPHILAFGAVLDSNGQKTEMSSSALGKLIMMLNQKPEALAQAVGMNVDKLKELNSKDTAGALIAFLEKLQAFGNEGGLTVLAPLFKDMGMDGVRMSQVLATLAAHLDEVKWQFGEADKAFREMTSASKEYELFNNTVQAGLDKAKKRISELSIELGEKLLPVMSHVYTSSSMFLRALNIIVDFIIKYRTEIVSATAVLTAYYIGVNAVTIATKASSVATMAWNAVMSMVTGTTKAYTTAMTLSRDALVGCSLAHGRLSKEATAMNIVTKAATASTLLMRATYFALTLQFSAAATSLKSLYVVMAANPYGLILTALAAVGVAIYKNIQARKEKHEQIMKEIQAERELMKEHTEAEAKIRMLSKVLNDNTRDLKDRKAALDDLKAIVPDYHADLTEEGKLINNNTDALDTYLTKLRESIIMKANREKLEKLYAQQGELQDTEKAQSKQYWDTRQTNTLQGRDRNSFISKATDAISTSFIGDWLGMDGEAVQKKRLEKTQSELNDVNRQIAELEKKVVPESATPSSSNSSGNNNTETSIPTSNENTKSAKEDKFKAEKEWKEREEALNRIAYATGEINYEQYSDRMLQIEEEYNNRKLQHTDLTENERLSIEADYFEARQKQQQNYEKRNIEDENEYFNSVLATLKQHYIDGTIDLKTFEESKEQLEIQHLRTLSSLYAEGSKEQVQVQKQYQDLLFTNQKKHQKEVEDDERKHQEELKRIKEKVFGNNPAENAALFQSELALLNEVYASELKAAGDNAKEKLRIEKAYHLARIELMKKYNQAGAEENLNFMQSFNNDVLDFLDSDMGEAITGSLDVLVSSMSSIFSQMTSIVQAELEIQTAAINKRYDAEVSAAEGNKYKINQIEKKREAEVAKAKNEANKKMYAMQVMQAVASTALAAINAYSSAAQVPLVGYILAPIAAATAVAAGMLQVAAIRKQQQASEAQGYSAGGFTPDGAVDQPRGIVHAGEWVASQKLVKNPKVRPILEALEYAQKNNTIGSLSASDVSQTITAPAVLAQNAVSARTNPQRVVIENSESNDVSRTITDNTTALKEYSDTMRRLSDRLDEPFITVNTVTGEFGSKAAQDEYDLLMRNKSPKSRRKV